MLALGEMIIDYKSLVPLEKNFFVRLCITNISSKSKFKLLVIYATYEF